MKSHLTFYVELFKNVIQDCTFEGDEKSSSRDIAYLFERGGGGRLAHEGLPLLTVVLPAFGKQVLRWIEDGYVSNRFDGFRHRRGSLLPELFQGWTKRIFSHDGCVRPDADPYALSELLQICMLCYKLEIPFSEESRNRVVEKFVQCEHEIPTDLQTETCYHSVLSLARRLVHEVLGSFDPKDIKPGHGPGAVSTGERGNEKFSFTRKYQRLHSQYPYYEYFSSSMSAVGLLGRGDARLPQLSHEHSYRVNRGSGACGTSGWYGKLEAAVLPVARVVLVPKDSRGPRLISMEPLEIQWIQQGIMRKLVPYIETHPLTRGKVNFTDQTFNQASALKSSMTMENATLDLKEASDRISLALFRYLFPENVVEAFESCRSTATELPNGELLSLRKFAPMGSALCFPVLALTIWALTEATLREHSLSTRGVLVFGDDLIVPSEAVPLVIRTLQAAGLLVNQDKSFVRSQFRESCGMDAFKGVQVTPVRLKKPFTGSPSDSTLYLHLIALSENFFNKGLWKVTRFLRATLREVYGKVPWTHDNSYPGYYCPDPEMCKQRNISFKKRWNADLQRDEILVKIVHQPTELSELSEAGRALKGLTGLYEFASEDFRVTLRKVGVFRRRYCAV